MNKILISLLLVLATQGGAYGATAEFCDYVQYTRDSEGNLVFLCTDNSPPLLNRDQGMAALRATPDPANYDYLADWLVKAAVISDGDAYWIGREHGFDFDWTL